MLPGRCRVKAVARTAVVALLAMSVFWTAARLHAEPLLACMVAGVIVINRKCAASLWEVQQRFDRYI